MVSFPMREEIKRAISWSFYDVGGSSRYVDVDRERRSMGEPVAMWLDEVQGNGVYGRWKPKQVKPKGRKSESTHTRIIQTPALLFNSFKLFSALAPSIKLPMAPSTASSSSSASDSPSLASKALNQGKYVVTGGALVYYFGVGTEFSDVLHTSGLPRYVFALESFCQLGATKRA